MNVPYVSAQGGTKQYLVGGKVLTPASWQFEFGVFFGIEQVSKEPVEQTVSGS